MTQFTRLPFGRSADRGFRLHKLEVFNWGTFDGQVYTVRPNGNSALLVGQNGSGKSTLVDALLTLLVKPGVRNFNVAAGAKKRERDERTYVRGAYDRGGTEEGEGTEIKYLRPKPTTYSVILAYFVNLDSGKSFTIAQLLFLAGDLSVDKVYCFADDERSIQVDFAGLTAMEGVVKTLRERGFRASKTFQDFDGWFTKATSVKPKAMVVFNQTVAVKDIKCLNDFIRDHMLERRDWNENVERLLGHFQQLSEAHCCLVRARRQAELLEPVARYGDKYRKCASDLAHAEKLSLAIDGFFAEQTLALFEPEISARTTELNHIRTRKEELTRQHGEAVESTVQIREAINREGGERLAQIPHLIEREKDRELVKQKQHDQVLSWMRSLGRGDEIKFIETSDFEQLQADLPGISVALKSRVDTGKKEQEQATLGRAEARRECDLLKKELSSLESRRENIPEWCVSLRAAISHELGIPAKELPFAAELIQVLSSEREWEASIEKVLHGFALSLLVPEKYYQVVAAHVDRTRLVAQGQGQRLVYLRVAGSENHETHLEAAPRSLLHKLKFREGQALLPWVKAELQSRFDYVCCDTIEEFQLCRSPALTRNRHVKSGSQRHEKDDRSRTTDPRNFVLGWDNREKKERLTKAIQQLDGEDHAFTAHLKDIETTLNELRGQAAAVVSLQEIASHDEINFLFHQQQQERLHKEQRAIEKKSTAIQALKEQLKHAEDLAGSLNGQRDKAVGQERELELKIKDAQKIVSAAEKSLQDFVAVDNGQGQLLFGELAERCKTPPLSIENAFVRKEELRRDLENTLRKLRKDLEPLRNSLLSAMTDFLKHAPEEMADLRPGAEYLDSFLGLRQRILDDDLPRHERRFKERLNQKVIEEIGLFRSALEQERRGIQTKIEQLNLSLKELEYRPNAHIRLDSHLVRDPEITEFQAKLRECVEGSFEDSPEANEARYVRIHALVGRLQDEGNRRWRDKVTDIRRWFDFCASVMDRQTHKAIAVYQDSNGQSGGEKAKLAFTILVAAIAYQYDLDVEHPVSDRFHFVVVDEMFSKVDDQYAEYALELFQRFGLQLLIVAPLDAKARVTQPYVGSYMHVVKKNNRSSIFEMTVREFRKTMDDESDEAAFPAGEQA